MMSDLNPLFANQQSQVAREPVIVGKLAAINADAIRGLRRTASTGDTCCVAGQREIVMRCALKIPRCGIFLMKNAHSRSPADTSVMPVKRFASCRSRPRQLWVSIKDAIASSAYTSMAGSS
jgi:hypothetical protein